MPMLKTLSADERRTCASICEYLMIDKATGEVRARAVYLANLDPVNLMWGEEMDADRARFSRRLRRRGGRKATRAFYHLILSPDPADNLSVEEVMEYSVAWAAQNLPEEHYQYAIVVHDDSKRRIADGSDGIVHAHVVVNPVEMITGRRIQIAKGASRRAQVEAGELGPEYLHEDIMADSAQRLAQVRNWHAFDNEDRSYKKCYRAQAALNAVADEPDRTLACAIAPQQADELAARLEELGVAAELLERDDGAFVLTFPAAEAVLAKGAVDYLIEQADEEALCKAGEAERVLNVRADVETSLYIAEQLERRGIRAHVAAYDAYAEIVFRAADQAGLKSLFAKLDRMGTVSQAELMNASEAFGDDWRPESTREAFLGYDAAFAPLKAAPDAEHLSSAEVSMRLRGELGWKDKLRSNIESAARRSLTEEEMRYRLGTAGIKVREWSGGLVYTDAKGHVIRDSVLGPGFIRKVLWGLFLPFSWLLVIEELRQRSMRERAIKYAHLIARENARKREIVREMNLIFELENVLVREDIHSWEDLDSAEEAVKQMGTDLRIELQKLGPKADRARELINDVVDLRVYGDYAAEYAELERTDREAAREFYRTFGFEVDGYTSKLEHIRDTYGIGLDQLDAALEEANAVSQQLLDTQAAFDGTARRLSDIRTARDRARWVHSEVERRAAQEKIDRGDMNPALRDIVNKERITPKSFYKKERSPYWVLNMTKETYKKFAERNRAARANFKRAEPAKYKGVPAYMKAEEQIKRSQIEQKRRANKADQEQIPAQEKTNTKAKRLRARSEER